MQIKKIACIFLAGCLLLAGCGPQADASDEDNQIEESAEEETDDPAGIDGSDSGDNAAAAENEQKASGDAQTAQEPTGGSASGSSLSAGAGNWNNEEAFARLEEESVEKQFYITEIDDPLFARMKGKSYKDNCTVPREDLRYVHILHKTLDGESREGELVVSRFIAEDVLEIFRALYDADYPIEKVRLVDEYDADDEKSMADNNSSAFNYRTISYSTKVSKHGLGMAVDINTRYNPYVKTVNGKLSVEPANGADYVDRSREFDYKIDTEDLAYQLFTEHGFEWGGSWSSSKDYQHFEIPTSVIRKYYPNY